MTDANPVLAEVWRGDILECVHRGTAVIARADGEIVGAWGDPARVILPRSACKMLQALPLVESGAAERAGLGSDHLALACASHQGAVIHTDLARKWLADLGLGEADLRCGPQVPDDGAARRALRDTGAAPGQLHNNCSGKHSGFLTLNHALGGAPEYVAPDHPVQRAVRDAVAEICGEEPAGHAIDGCSAPNFAVTIGGFATALARFATGQGLSGARAEAVRRLREAMVAHPLLVAGEGRACTRLMGAMGGVAVKTGAEGVFAAILPAQGFGIAVKIDDGSTRGSHAAIAALLARAGALDRGHPLCGEFADSPLLNRRGLDCGRLRAAPALSA